MILSEADHNMMRHALALGRRGLGQVWPNPAVGCVIVQGGRIVGRGRTGPGGRPHAETEALKQAGPEAHGATVYVTLEPCAHHGKTPPCADALIAAGVSRVVVALEDPNPKVNGQGIARLRSAGIEVDVGCEETQAARDNAGFLSAITRGRPILTLKLAASLDGRIATASGESRWITGPMARRVVHTMRARHDGVLIGGGTARMDDPDLTVRGQGAISQPVRIVATRHLDLPTGGKLARTARDVPVWLMYGPGPDPKTWEDIGATMIEVEPGADRQLSVERMLRVLADRGITRVLCEGGGTLAASLLAARVVDELVVFHAGLALGAEGTPGIGAMGLGALADAERFELVTCRPVGPDSVSIWRPRDT